MFNRHSAVVNYDLYLTAYCIARNDPSPVEPKAALLPLSPNQTEILLTRPLSFDPHGGHTSEAGEPSGRKSGILWRRRPCADELV